MFNQYFTLLMGMTCEVINRLQFDYQAGVVGDQELLQPGDVRLGDV
jgi:hypothetical protein